MLGTILEFARKRGVTRRTRRAMLKRFPDKKRKAFLDLEKDQGAGRCYAQGGGRGRKRTGLAAIRANAADRLPAK